MKRSHINAVIRKMEKLVDELRFQLPPFLKWTPEEWREKGHDYDEIRDNMLGWDVTDYGMGNYAEMGIALITLRNGNAKNAKYPKTYAEKLIMIEEGQVAPMHFHWKKMEDIINRGGGNVIFHLHNATKDGKLDSTDVEINQDGRKYLAPAGVDIILKPGDSLTLRPYQYHEFIGQPGTGTVLLGEVSMCNDDNADNRFLDQFARFPTIEEDEPPYRLLCTEYPLAK
ncbi:D-lyxose/D-mannose family sugar isomerase [Telmatospirillum sp.]|uniref:D-lyxose/D-mannose family sugar isomerase n=1 Tax=Telmatospirillum sp. TaxID=2079197 RepID=UPI00284DC2DA|nr:D-lyxose/D-mannose family sugar isomerase [Telmatospirillum sp.]MDR3438132.1 D-lyxose/D-mannose family sugar isomerase [Telmatospirillum sp.]